MIGMNKEIGGRNQKIILSAICSQPTRSQQDHLENALRSYAGWLVRAVSRKMADSTPNNSPRIDLTSGGNKCSNTLIDNELRRAEDGG
jgi:hypothetical protein